MLRPLTGDKWQRIREKIEAEGKLPSEGAVTVESEEASIYSATQALRSDGGVVLDAHRELRVKLYLGQVSERRCARPQTGGSQPNSKSEVLTICAMREPCYDRYRHC